MSKADIISLAKITGNGQLDTSPTIDASYEHILAGLANAGVWNRVFDHTFEEDESTFQLPEGFVRLVAAVAEGRSIPIVREATLNYKFGPAWRSAKGAPETIVVEHESTRTVRIGPIPDGPFTIRFFYVAMLEEDGTLIEPPSWLTLPLSLLVVEREFSLESACQDLQLSSLTGELGRKLLLDAFEDIR